MVSRPLPPVRVVRRFTLRFATLVVLRKLRSMLSLPALRKNSRARTSRARISALRQAYCEVLEDRRLLSVSVVGIPNWVEQGPGSTNGGQDFTFSSNNVSGATNALAAHPTNADILYAGTVGGGIWRNTGATSGGSWEPLTDQFPSLS